MTSTPNPPVTNNSQQEVDDALKEKHVVRIHLEPIPVYSPKFQHLLVERANDDELKAIFNKYARDTVGNQKVLKCTDFIQHYLGLMNDNDVNKRTLKIFADLVDLNKDGYVNYDEFKLFEELLCSPDVLYKCAFQLFDHRGSGYVDFESFKEIMTHTTINSQIPFDFNSSFISMYFGEDRKRQIGYSEFTQMLHDYQEEYMIQAFRKFDKTKSGHILSANFYTILKELKGHLLSPVLKENLLNVFANELEGQSISFPYFTAFNYLLNNMELIKKIYLTCTNGSLKREVSKGEFLQSAQQFSQITPLEVNILFTLASAFRNDGKLTFREIEKISPLEEDRMPYRVKARLAEEKFVMQNRNFLTQVLESGYRFGLGSIAGAIGAFAVYPIDLVKTRMQNQRSKTFVGEVMYKNSFDCFRKVVRHEGLLGLYKGLAVQLIGVAPEKAIKLTVNDLVRDKFAIHMGHIPLYGEIIAGGCAGMCQVIFTNPMEIVKIRLQVAGEIKGGRSERTLQIVKDLGLKGLYKGVRACLLRDIPFSAIYFPTYSHTKKALADENGHNNPWTLFYAGFIAGVPAAGLCTPADVIKTRIQVKERQGLTQYSGVVDAAIKIYKEEGGRAFWKGSGARVFRSSPQFAFTLGAYEILQRLLYVDFGGRKPEGSQTDVRQQVSTSSIESLNPDHIGGYKLATVTFEGLENKFGLCFPKFNKP